MDDPKPHPGAAQATDAAAIYCRFLTLVEEARVLAEEMRHEPDVARRLALDRRLTDVARAARREYWLFIDERAPRAARRFQ